MTWRELVDRFGETGAQALVDHKLADEELSQKEVRRHPSAPECKELMQYLVLDTEVEVDERSETVSQLFAAAEESSSESEASGDSSGDADSDSSGGQKPDKDSTSCDV